MKLSWTWELKTLESEGGLKHSNWEVKGVLNIQAGR